MCRIRSGRIRPALWAALAIPLLAPHAGAKPKSIDLKSMLSGSEVVAVARFAGKIVEAEEGGSVELELTRVIKGTVMPGKHKVTFFDIPRVDPKDREFVVFLGKGMSWGFVAVPIPGSRLGDGVLRVYGFYNSNAYHVWPGLVTAAQIERFVKDGSLAYTFRGPLYFPQRGDAAWRAGAREIEASYDASGNVAAVRGLPELEGFPARPEVFVRGDDDEAEVVLIYSRHGDRPLEIRGRVQAAAKDGVMLTKFFVRTPDLPTPKAFEDYLSDQKQGATRYTVRLTCTPHGGELVPRTLTLTMGKERGTMPEVGGWTEAPLRLDSLGGEGRTMTATAKLDSGKELGLQFDRGREKIGPDIFRWAFQDWLLYDLMVDEIPGRVLLGGKEVGTFVASLGDVRDAESGHARLVPDPTPGREGDSPAPPIYRAAAPGWWAFLGVGGAAMSVWVIWKQWARRRRISR